MSKSKINLLLWQFEEARKLTLAGVEHLSKEQLFMPPIEGEWCIGSYLMHLAECDLGWLHTLSGKEVPEEIKKRSYYAVWYDCPEEFREAPKETLEPKEYFETIALTRKMFTDEVASLNDEDLDTIVETKHGSSINHKSKLYIINHHIDHEAHTRGQMFLLIRKAGWRIIEDNNITNKIKETSIERLDFMNNFIGYGNIEKAKIFFIGIEEGGSGFMNENDFYNWKNKVTEPTNLLNGLYYKKLDGNFTSKGPTERMQNHICRVFSKNLIPIQNPKDIGFYSNLYPFPSTNINTEYPPTYRQLFGIDSKEEYGINFRSHRINVFLNMINEIKKISEEFYFFILGTYNEDDLISMFEELGYNFPKELVNNNIIKRGNGYLYWRSSECRKIWVTGHPSYGWVNEKVIDEIVKEIEIYKKEKVKFNNI